MKGISGFRYVGGFFNGVGKTEHSARAKGGAIILNCPTHMKNEKNVFTPGVATLFTGISLVRKFLKIKYKQFYWSMAKNSNFLKRKILFPLV